MRNLILLAILLLASLLVACGGDDDDADDASSEAATTEAATDTATSESTSEPDTTAAGSGDGVFNSSQLPVSVTLTAGEGWEVPEDAPDLFAVIQTGAPNGYIDFVQPTQVYTYSSEASSELGEPPADYVQWFNELPFPTIVETQEVTVGGLQGTRLEIKNADNEDFALFKMADNWNYELGYLGPTGAVFAYVLGVDGTEILVLCGTENPVDFPVFSSTCEETLQHVEFGT